MRSRNRTLSVESTSLPQSVPLSSDLNDPEAYPCFFWDDPLTNRDLWRYLKPRHIQKEHASSQRSSARLPGTGVAWLRSGKRTAVGYAATFLYLEARSLLDQFAETGLIDFLTGHLFAFLFGFGTDSILNMVQAITWFLPAIQIAPPLEIIALGIGYYVFDVYLREPFAPWLLQEDH